MWNIAGMLSDSFARNFVETSDIIAFVALVVSIASLMCMKRYNRKKDTLDDFNRLQQEVLDKLNEYSDEQIKDIATLSENSKNEDYREITILLARIEHFAVGANIGIYNVRVIKRLAGKYFINLYKKLEPVIAKKRDKRPEAKHYDEFEKLTKKLTRRYKREDIIKKVEKFMNLKEKLTMPVGLYMFLLVLGVLPLVCLKIISCNEIGEDIAIGVTCSIIAGAIVAIFTDLRATKIKHATDKEKYELQVKELKLECGDLPCTICVTVCDHYKEKISELKSFDEWCNDLFNMKQEFGEATEKKEIMYCLDTVRNIRLTSEKAKELVLNNLDNENYGDEFIKKLEKLSNICGRIIREQKRGKYENCHTILVGEFKERVIATFPELEKDYNRKYNAETYAEEAENDEE